MTEAEARARLEAMVAASSEPTLSDAEVDDLVDLAKRADSEGRAPSDVAWVPTWDLNSAASEGWQRKAGKVVANFRFSSDGQSFDRHQVFEMCERRAADYAMRVVGSVPT